MIKKRYTVLIILCIIFLFAGYKISTQFSEIQKGVLWEEEKRENKFITIAGFSELYFKAGITEQSISFHNPKNNKCIMDAYFLLPDGESLFKAKDIAPGYGIKTIKLNRSLKTGDYRNCKFIIKCHSEEGIVYNGAVLTVNLYVR